MARFELYGSAFCPNTQDMRDSLEFRGVEFIEYDIDRNAAARARLIELQHGQRNVPMLVEDGKVIEVGWQGRSCIMGAE